MAKLFKHFGLGGGSKKGPHHLSCSPPQDPSGAPKAPAGGSVQELRLKGSPTKRSSVIIASRSPPSGVTAAGGPPGSACHQNGAHECEMDVRRHSDASSMRSLRPKAASTEWSPVHATAAGGGGARTRDGGRGVVSGVGGQRRMRDETTGGSQRYSGARDEGGAKGRLRKDGRGVAPPERAASVSSLTLTKGSSNGVDPLLLSDYSDPFDLKRENQALGVGGLRPSEEVSGGAVGAAGEEGPSLPPEDEYSVPYDVKLKDAKQKEAASNAIPTSSSGATIASDSDNYADPYEGGPALFSLVHRSANRQSSSGAIVDPSLTPLQVFVAEPGSFKSTESPPNVKDPECLSDSVDRADTSLEINPTASGNDADESKGNKFAADSQPTNQKSDALSKPPPGDETVKTSGLTSESPTRAVAETPQAGDIPLGFPDNALRLSPTATVAADDGDSGANATYDEPWDLYATRRGIEDRLKIAARRFGDKPPPVWDPAHRHSGAARSRGASLDGGYAPPGPPMEYEEPWDRKARDVERNLIVAKSAKEAARMLREGGGGAGGGEGGAASNRNCRIDERATEEYEDGTEERRIPTGARAGRDSARPESGIGYVHMCFSTSLPQHPSGAGGSGGGGHSPKRKWHMNTLNSPWSLQAESVDPTVPLEQQGWFHGSISRVDAEALLRVHREGSYLVRTSESNKSDFSLSLKSSRGFMHMKIVSRDGQLILGQFSQPFDDIPHMISFFTVNMLPIQGADHMFLLFPVHNELL